MQKIDNLMPLFLDKIGGLMDGGKIYIGVADGDPLVDPIQAYWDSYLTIPAAQPLKTLGGLIVNGVTPAAVFVSEDDYSQLVRDYNDVQVFYSPSVFTPSDSFQPLNSNLTAIALLTTTPFGRGLLELANSAALATATGIPAPLPLIGGTVTGNIIRQGAGVHPYWYDPAITGGRIFGPLPTGTPDPSSLPGDWTLYY